MNYLRRRQRNWHSVRHVEDQREKASVQPGGNGVNKSTSACTNQSSLNGGSKDTQTMDKPQSTASQGVSRRSLNHSARVKMQSPSKKIFQCAYCSCSYMDRTGLYRHTLRIHPEHTNKKTKSPDVRKSASSNDASTSGKRKPDSKASKQDEHRDTLGEQSAQENVIVTDVNLNDGGQVHSDTEWILPVLHAHTSSLLQISPIHPGHASSSNDIYIPGNSATHQSEIDGMGSLLVSESDINLLLEGSAQSTKANIDQPQQKNSTQGTHRSVVWPAPTGVRDAKLDNMIAEVFADEGSRLHTWRLPSSLLSSDYEANQWLHDVTLQVLTSTLNHVSSRMRHLIVEGVANGNGNDLRKIASFCLSLERISRQPNRLQMSHEDST